jgi:hypothetical protein
MESISPADPGVDRHHLISIPSYHPMKIHNLSCPTLGFTCSVRHVDPRICVDHQHRQVSYLLTRFHCSSKHNYLVSGNPFGCLERCGRVLLVGSLPSSSIVSPQRTPSGASVISLNGRVQVLLQLCSTTICSQIDRMNIYTETEIMYPKLHCSEFWDCNKNE